VAVLRIELQDGFDGDTVVCTLDGHEVARLSDVQSSLVTSLADVAEVEVPDEGPLTVSVTLPARGLQATARVEDPRTQRWVVARVVDGRLTAEPRSEQPGYL
jgi:hypothetical protein